MIPHCKKDKGLLPNALISPDNTLNLIKKIRLHASTVMRHNITAVKLMIANVMFILLTVPGYPLNSIPAEARYTGNESPVISSISLQSGILDGVTKEQVFSSSYKVSEIDWDLKPLYFAGVTLNTQFFSTLNLNFGFWTGMNVNQGKVRNYDFTSTTLLSYSEQNCIQERIKVFDSNVSYTFNLYDELSITGMLGYNYINLKMLAHGGYTEYPIGSLPKPFYGTGVIFEQVFNIPYIGLGGTYLINDIVYVQLFAMYSRFVFSDGTDYHVNRQREIYSTTYPGRYMSIIISSGWKINDYTSLVLTAEYTKIVTNRGSSYYIDVQTGIKSPTYSETSAVRFTDTSIRISAEQSWDWKM